MPYARASAIIPARAADVYAVLADYRHGHPNILPSRYFSDLEVERGGVGDGTIIRFTMRVMGTERSYCQAVSEPEPGRVLVEKDLDSDTTTTFTVTPLDDGQRAQVEIVTEWAAKPGLIGRIESVMTRRLLQSIYVRELEQLAAYVAREHAVAGA